MENRARGALHGRPRGERSAEREAQAQAIESHDVTNGRANFGDERVHGRPPVGVRGWGSRSGTAARGRDGRDSRPVRSRTGRHRGERSGPGCRPRMPAAPGRCRRPARRCRRPARSRAPAPDASAASWATTRSRISPGRSSYSLAALSSRQPPSDDWRAQSNQASTMARSRGRPRGSFSAGNRTWATKRWPAASRTASCRSSREPKWANTPLLDMPDGLRQRADRQPLQAGRAGDVVGAIDDRFAGGGAFAGGGECGHGRKIARPFVLILPLVGSRGVSRMREIGSRLGRQSVGRRGPSGTQLELHLHRVQPAPVLSPKSGETHRRCGTPSARAARSRRCC